MRHAEIAQRLREFYTLLAQLSSIDPSSLVQILNPDAPAPIRRTAALDVGYTEEVVLLMEPLPYVCKDANAWHPEIMPSTEPIDFTKCEDEEAFKIWREHNDDEDHEDEDGNEELIPRSLLRLTELHLYGTTLLYDTQSCLLVAWEPTKNLDDVIGYAHVPAKSPSEVLDSWIQGFGSFKYMQNARYKPVGW